MVREQCRTSSVGLKATGKHWSYAGRGGAAVASRCTIQANLELLLTVGARDVDKAFPRARRDEGHERELFHFARKVCRNLAPFFESECSTRILTTAAGTSNSRLRRHVALCTPTATSDARARIYTDRMRDWNISNLRRRLLVAACAHCTPRSRAARIGRRRCIG
jgi:hypothetical protein